MLYVSELHARGMNSISIKLLPMKSNTMRVTHFITSLRALFSTEQHIFAVFLSGTFHCS